MWDDLIERIYQEVDRRLKTVLVLFTGARAGLDGAMEELKRMRQEGYRLVLCFSDRGAARMEPEAMARDLGAEKVLYPGDVHPHDLADQYYALIVAEMTVNTLAKTALCITDAFGPELILNMIMKGRKVVCAVDACCPKRNSRGIYGYLPPDAMKAKWSSYLEDLESFGVRLAQADRLANPFIGRRVSAESANSKKSETGKEKEGSEIRQVHIKSKVVSNRQIAENRTCDRIIVNKDAIITQLAAENSLRYGIELLRLEN